MPSDLQQARHLVPVRIISSRSTTSAQLRTALMQIGFDKIAISGSFLDALSESKETPPAIVFFDAEGHDPNDISPESFVRDIHLVVSNPGLVAFFGEVSGNTLFEMLKAGAKGFIIAPFNAKALEDNFLLLQSGFEITDEVRNADTPQEAMAIVLANHLDHTAKIAAEHRESLKDPEGLAAILRPFRETVKLAQMMCDHDVEPLYDHLFHHLCHLADEADRKYNATRLRKTREMLRKKRRGS